MEQKETVAQEALRLISPIPANEFIMQVFSDNKGKCCVIGHYQRLKSKNPSDYRQYLSDMNEYGDDGSLREESRKFLRKHHNIESTIVDVNNSTEVNGYNQTEIKDRVTAFLKDMIQAGY